MVKKANRDWILKAPGELERIEAFFSGVAYKPHRHDTYAIGWTLAGVQRFNYRGEARHSQPGRTLVLHPDELHDGRAGTEVGFHYRVVYVEPELIQNVLGGKPLPFIEGGLSLDSRLYAAAGGLLGDFEHDLDPLQYEDAVYDLAIAMNDVSEHNRDTRLSFDYRAADLARQYILAHLDRHITLEDLERVSGRDRWKLSRDFRTLFGTSPYRYLTMRRLDSVRDMILAGESLAQAALACGFADQSHMNRNFKKTFGLTPKQWLKMLRP